MTSLVSWCPLVIDPFPPRSSYCFSVSVILCQESVSRFPLDGTYKWLVLGCAGSQPSGWGLWEHSWTDMWGATHLQLTSTASSQGDYLGLPFFWLPLRVVWHLQRATFFAPSLKMPLHLWVTHKSLMDSVFFLHFFFSYFLPFSTFFLFFFLSCQTHNDVITRTEGGPSHT